MTSEELLAYIFESRVHVLAGPFAAWLASSRQFKAFAITYRDKIRKKIRVIRDPEALRDLQCELETAYLLQARGFTVEYEKYGQGKTRGPDFTVTLRGKSFNLEVTRMRGGNHEPELALPAPQREHGKLIDMVCGKLGQMLPGMSNLLLVVLESQSLAGLDLPAAMKQLKALAEHGAGAVIQRRGFASSAEFFRSYQRLSGVLARAPGAQQPGQPGLFWSNPQARHPLPPALRAALEH